MTGVRIRSIEAIAILDSRAVPTLRVTTHLSDGTIGVASAPSGKSTGKREKRELRDGGAPYGGLGVERALANVRGPIAEKFVGMPIVDPRALDRDLVLLDGTLDRSRLGANAMVVASMSFWRAAAASQRIPLWQYFASEGRASIPIPLFNVINGGVHADGGLRLQEMMLVPHGLTSIDERIRCGAEIYAALRDQFSMRGFSTAVGDEGGLVYTHGRAADAIAILCAAIESAGYRVGTEVSLAIDAAANGFYGDDEIYSPEPGLRLSSDEMNAWWIALVASSPIVMLEDPLGEDDVAAWVSLTESVGSEITIVGDDNFVTDALRIRDAISVGAANAALLKPNQIGTVSETLEAAAEARGGGYRVVVSHRSGETADSFISDLAVGIGADFIKAGAPVRSERVEKYNRLLEIQEECRRM